jgi:hypothetical protein
VRLVENPGGLPKVVVYLNGVFSTRLVGDVSVGSGGTSTTFSNLPDTPVSILRLDFAGGSGGQFTATADLCSNPVNISGEFQSQSGKTVTPSAQASVVGCPKKTRGRWPTATVALSKLTTSSPTFDFTAKRGVGSDPLRSISIALPAPLSFDKSYLGVGVRASKSLSASFPDKHTMLLRAKSAGGVTSISSSVRKRALRVSSSLRKRVKKHPKLSFTVRFTEVGGRVLTRHLGARAR